MPTSIRWQLALDGAEQVRALFGQVGDAGEQSANRIKSAVDAAARSGAQVTQVATETTATMTKVGGLGSVLATAFSGVQSQIGNGLTAIRGLGEVTEHFGEVLNRVLPGWKEFATIAGAFIVSKEAAEGLRTLSNQAATLGITTEALEAFRLQAARVGVDQETLNKGLDKFAQALGNARSALEKEGEETDKNSEKNRVAIEAANLRFAEAQQAANKFGLAQADLASGIDKATLAQTHANEAFKNAKTTNDGSVAGSQKLRDAAAAQQIATANLTSAQGKLNQSYAEGATQGQKLTLAHDQMVLAINEAGRGATHTKTVFDTLGIDVTDTTKSIKDQFLAAADALNKIPNASDRAAIELKLFSRSWAELAPLVKSGSAGFELAERDLQRMGLAATEADKELGEKFLSSFEQMQFAVSQLTRAVGLQLGQIFTPIFNAVSNFILNNGALVKDFVSGLAGALTPVIALFARQLGAALDVLGNVLRFLISMFDEVAKLLHETFGTEISGAMIAFGLAVAAIFGPWRAFALVIAAVFDQLNKIFGEELSTKITAWALVIGAAIWAIGTAFSGVIASIGRTAASAGLPFTLIAAAIAVVGVAILLIWQHWQEIEPLLKKGIENFTENWRLAAQIFTSLWNTAVSTLQNAFLAMRDFVVGVIDAIDARVQAVANSLRNLIGLNAQATKAASETSTRAGVPNLFAGGGAVFGAGTATSDSIWARLSHGEWVMRAAAVNFYGHATMAAMNSMALPRFAAGGFVAPQGPRFAYASGGAVIASTGRAGAMHTLNLAIDGQFFNGLQSPERTFGKLLTFARGQRIRSAGRKPRGG